MDSTVAASVGDLSIGVRGCPPMARLPRFSLPSYPHHVIQRGNSRQPIFFALKLEGD